MPINLFDDLFSTDDDGEFGEDYVIIATFPAQFTGVCRIDPTHAYKKKDIVGKLESAHNPMIPVQGVCCNRCVRTVTHKKSIT